MGWDGMGCDGMAWDGTALIRISRGVRWGGGRGGGGDKDDKGH